MTPCLTTKTLSSNSRLRLFKRLGRWFSSEAPHVLLKDVTNPDMPPGAIISILTLNRPKANAMGYRMLNHMKECLSQLENKTESRCLIITSCSERVFSAGADLQERAAMTLEQAENFVADLRETMDRVSRLPMPVIAAVEGVALGGGLELALAADLRILSRNALVGLPETSLAILPGAGGTQRLPRLIGVARAKEMIYTAVRIDGEKAFDYGIAQHVVVPGGTMEKALDIAWKIAHNGPIAIQAAKYAIDEGMNTTSMKQALQIERDAYHRVIPTKDRLEGLAAFKDGRLPVYTGQ